MHSHAQPVLASHWLCRNRCPCTAQPMNSHVQPICTANGCAEILHSCAQPIACATAVHSQPAQPTRRANPHSHPAQPLAVPKPFAVHGRAGAQKVAICAANWLWLCRTANWPCTDSLSREHARPAQEFLPAIMPRQAGHAHQAELSSGTIPHRCRYMPLHLLPLAADVNCCSNTQHTLSGNLPWRRVLPHPRTRPPRSWVGRRRLASGPLGPLGPLGLPRPTPSPQAAVPRGPSHGVGSWAAKTSRPIDRRPRGHGG
jgi:hypothetical protein